MLKTIADDKKKVVGGTHVSRHLFSSNTTQSLLKNQLGYENVVMVTTACLAVIPLYS